MQVIPSKKQLHLVLQKIRDKNHTIGLVPTMGALHKGHLSLVKRAVAENDITVVSIFVNPTQFDRQEDLENYPKDFGADLALLKDVSGELVVFAPTNEEIYNGTVESQEYDFEGLDASMEGAYRKGHFEGVATIVELLLRTVAPNRAYFGEKDFQQLQIIKKLVAQKELPVAIVACAIEREPNGLARSSRNERLTDGTRNEAALIYEVLQTAKEKFGTESAKDIANWVEMKFVENQLFELEYFQMAETESLAPIVAIKEDKKYRAFIAVYAEGIRLIDNIALN